MYNNSEFGFNYDMNEIGFQLLNPEDINAPYNCPYPNQDFEFANNEFGQNNLPLVPDNICENNDFPPGPDYYDPMVFGMMMPDDIQFNFNGFNCCPPPPPDFQMNFQPMQDQGCPTFLDLYNDNSFVLNPTHLHLLPEKYWSQQPPTMTFAQIVNSYFKQNRTQNSTFMLKLYNLLLITLTNPQLEQAIGIRWVNDNVLQISRSGLINVFNVRENTVDGSMFHRQGNFSTHNFVEINESNFQQFGFYEFPQMPRIQGDTKFFIHEPHQFTRRPMTEGELKLIRYSNEAKKNYRSRSEINEMIPNM